MTASPVSRYAPWFWPTRFQPVPGSEQGQALVRLRGGSIVLTSLLVLQAGGVAIAHSWWTMMAYTVFAYLWVWVTGCGWLNQTWRIRCTLVADNLILASGFYFGGEAFALVMWAIMFASIGYGLRFGARCAMKSVALGLLCAGTALAASPYWRSHPLLAAGVLASLVILPAYAVRLAELIARDKQALEQKAAHLEATSRTDPLTGVLNRRGLLACLTRHLNSLADSGESSALLFIDLDGFKTVNDVAGHDGGDAVLQLVAQVVTNGLRPADHVCRLGGDEFVALLTCLMAECDAYEVAQRILAEIRQLTVAGYPELRVGASIGICLLPNPQAPDAESALKLADRLMYQAKRAGKNQIFALHADLERTELPLAPDGAVSP